MPAKQAGQQNNSDAEAVQHVTDAHGILKELNDELGEHPRLAEAILKLEMALSILATKSGGML